MVLPTFNLLDKYKKEKEGIVKSSLLPPQPVKSNTLLTLKKPVDNSVIKSLSNIQKTQPAPTKTSTAPAITGKDIEYYTPGQLVNPKDTTGKPVINQGEKSTVSRAYLDYASPKLTSIEDHKRDLYKNRDIIKGLKDTGKLTEEDIQEMLVKQNKGLTRDEILGQMVEKKRYQIGTQERAASSITKNNINSIFSPSEKDQYLASKPKADDETLKKFIEEKKAEGKKAYEIKDDIILMHLQRDIENKLYDSLNGLQKADYATTKFLKSTTTNILASIPKIAATIASLPTLSEIAFGKREGQKQLEEFTQGEINNLNKKVSEVQRELGYETGETGKKSGALTASEITAEIIPFFLLPEVSAAKWSSYLAKSPKIAATINTLIRSAALPVVTSAVGEGRLPTKKEIAEQGLINIAAEGAFGAGGKILSATGAKISTLGLFKFGARKRLARELADEGEVGTVKSIFKWLKDRKLNKGSEEDMVTGLTNHTEESYKAVNEITKKMDQAGVKIPDNGYLTGSLEKIQKKLKGSKSPEQLDKLKRVDKLLAKAKKDGGLPPSEANEVKRLLDENLDMFTMEGFIKKPQKDNVALRSGVRKSIEDAGEKLGFDVRAINAETAVSRKMRDAIVDKMLSDNIAERMFAFGAKNLLRGGFGLSVGPFDNSTTEGKLGNFFLGIGAGYAAKPFVENQRFKNFIGRMLTAFSKREVGALEQFMKNGKTTPQTEAAISRFVEKLRNEEKDIYDAIHSDMKLLNPPKGLLPKSRLPEGTSYPRTDALAESARDTYTTKIGAVTSPTQKAGTKEVNPIIQQIKKSSKKTPSAAEGTPKGQVSVKEVKIPSNNIKNSPIIEKLGKKSNLPAKTNEDWTKKDFTKSNKAEVKDSFGNTVINEPKGSKIVVNGKTYNEVDLPDTSKSFYQKDGEYFDYVNGKMVSQKSNLPKAEGKTVPYNLDKKISTMEKNSYGTRFAEPNYKTLGDINPSNDIETYTQIHRESAGSFGPTGKKLTDAQEKMYRKNYIEKNNEKNLEDGLAESMSLYLKSKEGMHAIEIKDWTSTKQGYVLTYGNGNIYGKFADPKDAIEASKRLLTLMQDAEGKGIKIVPKMIGDVKKGEFTPKSPSSLPMSSRTPVKYSKVDDLASELQKNSYTTTVDKKVYRGEGKGIGNATLVKGQYFADSKEFASEFGNVKEYIIPKGSKVFDLDKVKGENSIIPQKILVDNEALTKYLIDNGFDYTRNTNTRGVEFVKLNKTLNELKTLASKSKDLADFKQKVMANYDKYREELARLSKNYTNADNSRLRSPMQDIWDTVKQS